MRKSPFFKFKIYFLTAIFVFAVACNPFEFFGLSDIDESSSKNDESNSKNKTNNKNETDTSNGAYTNLYVMFDKQNQTIAPNQIKEPHENNPNTQNAEFTSLNKQLPTITVSEAKKLPNETLVLLNGYVVQDLGDKEYIFRDSTGEIIIEVDDPKVRQELLSIGKNDRIEIYGEIDIDSKKTKIEIEVESIRKINF